MSAMDEGPVQEAAVRLRTVAARLVQLAAMFEKGELPDPDVLLDGWDLPAIHDVVKCVLGVVTEGRGYILCLELPPRLREDSNSAVLSSCEGRSVVVGILSGVLGELRELESVRRHDA